MRAVRGGGVGAGVFGCGEAGGDVSEGDSGCGLVKEGGFGKEGYWGRGGGGEGGGLEWNGKGGMERGMVRVSAHTKSRTPFLRDRFRQARDARFGKGVVGLSRVAVDAARAADVDDGSGLVVFEAEIGRRGADEAEGGGRVQREDCRPLLVAHFVDHAVPGEAGVVDEDVDFAGAEVGGGADEVGDVVGVEHVAWDGECFPAGGVDALGDGFGFGCFN